MKSHENVEVEGFIVPSNRSTVPTKCKLKLDTRYSQASCIVYRVGDTRIFAEVFLNKVLIYRFRLRPYTTALEI